MRNCYCGHPESDHAPVTGVGDSVCITTKVEAEPGYCPCLDFEEDPEGSIEE